MLTVSRVVDAMTRRYPPAWAEAWDAVGLVCGDPEASVHRVLLAVDPAPAVIEEAVDLLTEGLDTRRDELAADETAPRTFAPVQDGFTTQAETVLPYAPDRILVQFHQVAMDKAATQVPMVMGAQVPDARIGYASVDALARAHGVVSVERPYVMPSNGEKAASFGRDRWFMYRFQTDHDMVRVAEDVESDPQLQERLFHPLSEQSGYRRLPEAIGQAACRVAESVGAAAILAFTQTGSTAALVAKYKPPVPVFAVTPSHVVRRRMALYAGVRSIRVDIEGDTEAQIRSVEESVLDAGVLQKGDVVIITMGSPVSDPGTTNLLKIHRLGIGPFFEVH